MLFTVIGIALGVAVALFLPWVVTPGYSIYLAVSILAALDSVFGGIYASFKKNFNMAIFISGLFCNAALACLIIFFGEKLGLDLYLAVVVVFGTRLFNNFASIRHHIISNYAFSKKKIVSEESKEEISKESEDLPQE